MNDSTLTLPSEHGPKRSSGAVPLLAGVRSAFVYIAFTSSVAFSLAIVFGALN